MDNENLNNEELETVEEAVEVAEEIVEEVTEEAESVETEVEAEAAEEAVQTEAEEEIAEEYPEEYSDEVLAKSNGGKIAAIVGGAVVVVLAIVAALWYFGVINPYERGYVDVSGVTLEELAEQSGYTVSEFKKANGLPMLMPKSTHENAVQNNVKLKSAIVNSGMTFEDFKAHYGWGDNITENSTVGEALGEAKLSVMLGLGEVDEETAKSTLDEFKKYYELGDDVTLDTPYKEIRTHMDEKAREMNIKEKEEAEKAAEEAEKATQEAEKAE